MANLELALVWMGGLIGGDFNFLAFWSTVIMRNHFSVVELGFY